MIDQIRPGQLQSRYWSKITTRTEHDEKQDLRRKTNQDPRKEGMKWCEAASRKGSLGEVPESSASVYTEPKTDGRRVNT